MPDRIDTFLGVDPIDSFLDEPITPALPQASTLGGTPPLDPIDSFLDGPINVPRGTIPPTNGFSPDIGPPPGIEPQATPTFMDRFKSGASKAGQILRPYAEIAGQQYETLTQSQPTLSGRRNVGKVLDVAGEFTAEQLGKRGVNPYVAAGAGTVISTADELGEFALLGGGVFKNVYKGLRYGRLSLSKVKTAKEAKVVQESWSNLRNASKQNFIKQGATEEEAAKLFEIAQEQSIKGKKVADITVNELDSVSRSIAEKGRNLMVKGPKIEKPVELPGPPGQPPKPILKPQEPVQPEIVSPQRQPGPLEAPPVAERPPGQGLIPQEPKPPVVAPEVPAPVEPETRLIEEAKNRGYEVKFIDEKPKGYYGKHFSDKKIIEIYTKGRTPEQIDDALSHEVGHVVDFTRRGIVADPMGDSILGFDKKLRAARDSDIYFRNPIVKDEAVRIRAEFPKSHSLATTQKEVYADAYKLMRKNPERLKEIAPRIYKELKDFLDVKSSEMETLPTKPPEALIEPIETEPAEVTKKDLEFEPKALEPTIPEAPITDQVRAGDMAKLLEETGVEGGGPIRGEGELGLHGEVTGRIGRVSTNPEWYKNMSRQNKPSLIKALRKFEKNEVLSLSQQKLVVEAMEMEARSERGIQRGKLDDKTARRFLREAKGDRDIARKLATEQGFTLATEPDPKFRDVKKEKEVLSEARKMFRGKAVPTKKVIRETTKVVKVEPKVYTDRVALKQSLKRQERTSKEAYRYGRNLANEANRLIKKIRSADIEEITHAARVEIEALQKELKGIRKVDQLRDLNARIQGIKEIGKQELATNKELRTDVFEANKEVLVKQTLGDKGLAPRKPILKPALARPHVFLRLQGLRPSRWLDKLDRGQDFKGPFNQTFYDPVNRAFDNEVAMSNVSTVEGIDILKRNEVSQKELRKELKVGDLKVPIDQAMHIYGGFNNPETRAAIVFGNGIGVKEQEAIIKALPDKYKKAADELIAEMDTHHDRLRLAFHEYTNGKEDLGKVAGNYIPMKRVDMDYQTTDAELLDELAHRKGLKKAYAERGFTKGRVNVPPEYQKPIQLGLAEIYFKHIGKREHFIAMGNLVKDLQRLSHDPGVVGAIRQEFGKEYVTELQDYVNRVGNPSFYRSHSSLEKMVRVARQKAVVVNLGFNLLTMGKQIPSLALMLSEVGPIELLSAIQETVTNFDEINKFVEKNDPQMKSRNIERELEEQKRISPSGPASAIKKLESSSLKGIMFFDQVVTRAAWISKYRPMMKAGASHTEAVEESQKAVLRTQPASAPKDIASFYASNEFLNLFTQFTNQLNQMYNMATYDIPMRAKMGKFKASILGGAGIAMDMALIYLMSHGRFPNDKEEIKEAVADTAISTVPVIGPMINSWRKGFSGLPATFSVIQKASRAVSSLYKGVKEGDNDALKKALDNGIYTAAFAGGIPYNQIKRTITGLMDLKSGETEDLRRLLFSEYQLKEKKKPSSSGLFKAQESSNKLFKSRGSSSLFKKRESSRKLFK